MTVEALRFEQWKSMWLCCDMLGSFDVSPAMELADGYWMAGALVGTRRALAALYGVAA